MTVLATTNTKDGEQRKARVGRVPETQTHLSGLRSPARGLEPGLWGVEGASLAMWSLTKKGAIRQQFVYFCDRGFGVAGVFAPFARADKRSR